MVWSPEARFEPHNLRLGPAMGGQKTYRAPFDADFVKQYCRESKNKRVDSGAQLDPASPYGFS
jgi:hypothetical protein